MSRYALVLLIILWNGQTIAQLRNKHWILGGGAGMSFEVGGAVPFATGLTSYYLTTSSLSDQSGQLRLVVTNEDLRDGTLSVMPNGAGPLFPLGGGTHQAIVIFPRTGNGDLYDVIIRPGDGYPRYNLHPTHLLVDMTLNNGNGDVVAGSQVALQDSVIPCTAGTTHANGQDYWYVTHERGTDAFLAYRLDANGFDTVPVVSNTGPVHVFDFNNSGNLYFTPQQWSFNVTGDKLFATGFYGVYNAFGDTLPAVAEVYGFDQATGQINHELSLPDLRIPLYCEWSPDGSKIYVAERDDPVMDLYQYDLSSGDSATIATSRTLIVQWPVWYYQNRFQLGPDGRIYISSTDGQIGSSYLSCITEPNLSGLACGFVQEYFNFPLTAYPGILPTMLKQYHDSSFPLANTDAREVYDEQLAVWPNPAESMAYVKLPLRQDVDGLLITDAAGRLALRIAPSDFTIQPLDLSGLAPGAYMLGAYAGQQRVGVAHFVVQ